MPNTLDKYLVIPAQSKREAITIRVAPDLKTKLRWLAAQLDVSQTTVLRALIMREYDEHKNSPRREADNA